MKRVVLMFLLMLLVTLSFGQLRDISTLAGTKAKLYLPLNYDSVGEFPLMIFLHGIGEKGTNLNLVLKHGTPWHIANGKNFPFIMVAPQLASGNYTGAWIDEVLEHVAGNFKVDRKQIWLVGFSLGGGGVWTYIQNANYIKKLAAFVPIAGAGNDVSKASIIVNEGILGWVFHSSNDLTVPYSVSTRMVSAVNQLAKKDQIKLTTYASGHIIATKACDPSTGLYEWLYWQRRPELEEAVISSKIVNGNLLKVKTVTKEYSIPIPQ